MASGDFWEFGDEATARDIAETPRRQPGAQRHDQPRAQGHDQPRAERHDLARQITELQSRLSRLGAGERPGDEIAAMTDTVARLARTIRGGEAPAERPRPADRATAAADRPAEDPRLQLIAESLRELERNAAGAGRHGAGALRERIEALRAKQEAEAEGRAARLDRTLRELRGRLGTMGFPNPGEASAPAAPAAAQAAAPARRSAAELQQAIAEIAARQQTIDRLTSEEQIARQQETDAESGRTLDARLDEIKAELARVGEAVAGLAEDRPAAMPALGGLNQRLDSLDRLRDDENATLADIQRRLDQLAGALDGAARETTLSGIEAGNGHIIDRLDLLSHSRPDSDRLEELAAGMAELGRAMTAIDPTADLMALTERMEALTRAIDEIGAAGPASAPDLAALDERLGDLVQRIDEIGRNAADHEHLDELTAAVMQLGATLERPAPAVDMNALEARFSQIDSRLETFILSAREDDRLDALAEAVAALGAALDAASPAADLAMIEAHFETFHGRLEEVAHIVADRQGLDELTAAVAALGDTVDRLDPAADIAGLERRTAQINDRLDQMAALLPDPKRMEALVASVAEIGRAVSAADRGAEIAALGDQIAVLGDQVADIGGQVTEMGGQVAGMSGTVEAIGRSQPEIEARLEELGVSLAALDAAGRNADAEADARLASLADRFEAALARMPRADLVAGLLDRLEGVARRLDQLMIERDDPSLAFDALRYEIADLRRAVTENARRPAADALEDQLRALAARLDTLPGEGDTFALAQIEAQVARLADRLDLDDLSPSAYAQVEENLAKLEGLLHENRSESVEAARDAAREAVLEFAGAAAEYGLESPVIQALKQDLASLQAASENTDQRTQDTLEAVHETMEKVVTRLAALESEARAEETDKTDDTAEPTDAFWASVAAAEAAAAASPFSPAAAAETDGTTGRWIELADAHRPLEPGSGRPVLPAADDDDGIAPATSLGVRKADFIAAARRAAQAAAAESAAIDDEPEPQNRSGTLSRLGRVMRSRRRPLVVAAAAVVLTIATIRLFDETGIGVLQSNAAIDSTTTASIDKPASDQDEAGTILLPSDLAESAPSEADAQTAEATATDEPAEPVDAAAEDASSEAADGEASDAARVAFAPPEAVGERFDDTADAPPATGFVPPPASEEAEAVETAAADAAAAATDTDGTAADGTGTDGADAGDAAMAPERSAAIAAMARSAQALTDSAARTVAQTTPEAGAVPMPAAAIGPERLLQAAAAGDPAALFEVAARYAEGRGVATDMAEAARWYELAAERGLAVAQYRLGSLYERGQGVDRDREEAERWYRAAADQGNRNAMHNLAVLLSETGGDGVHAEAADLFSQAAALGVRDSQYNLAVIYARGLGRTQDLVQSYKWFAIAAAQGDADAASRRDEVGKALGADQLAQARVAAKAWQKAEMVETANAEPATPESWSGTGTKSIAAAKDGPDLVQRIQGLLSERGFDPGPADGVAGPKTREAIRAFERQNGRPVTGTIAPDLVEALESAAS